MLKCFVAVVYEYGFVLFYLFLFCTFLALFIIIRGFYGEFILFFSLFWNFFLYALYSQFLLLFRMLIIILCFVSLHKRDTKLFGDCVLITHKLKYVFYSNEFALKRFVFLMHFVDLFSFIFFFFCYCYPLFIIVVITLYFSAPIWLNDISVLSHSDSLSTPLPFIYKVNIVAYTLVCVRKKGNSVLVYSMQFNPLRTSQYKMLS